MIVTLISFSSFCTINPHTALTVRSGISIVPQSPDLFEGTLRENVDPVGEYEDIDIWTVLKQVRPLLRFFIPYIF
jgi:ABC-type multidrug transport system fused ATPase/permease subunit